MGSPEKWNILQNEINTWATKNFGQNPAWQPTLGVIEEVAEFMAALEMQPCPDNARTSAIADALGDQCVYALNLCEKVGLNFGDDIAVDCQPQDLTERELIGVLGVMCRAILKNAQGIRAMDFQQRRENIRVALTVWFRWAEFQAGRYKTGDMWQVVSETWESVRKRDWTKNPTNAHEVR